MPPKTHGNRKAKPASVKRRNVVEGGGEIVDTMSDQIQALLAKVQSSAIVQKIVNVLVAKLKSRSQDLKLQFNSLNEITEPTESLKAIITQIQARYVEEKKRSFIWRPDSNRYIVAWVCYSIFEK